MENYKLLAKTFAGLEPVLAHEVKDIGGKRIQEGCRAVSFEGDLAMVYKSNYLLRTALRVLKEICVFKFKDIDDFYINCRKVKWFKYFTIDQNFIVNSTVSHSKDFKNSMFASLKVKDAIVDLFRSKTGKRPNVNTQNPDIYINVHINKNTCTLSLDSSGESLHKRGYRAIQGKAPLSEVLAAGLIKLSGWDGSTDFIDPMCGSGTLPIEAAMIAQNIAPGRFRKNFSFENWLGYDAQLFEKIKKEHKTKPLEKKIYASDISKEDTLIAQTNARRARVFSSIHFQTIDMKDLKINTNNATLIINPPYGERLIYNNINDIYSMIGERLKHQFAGNTAWVLTSSKQYLNNIGLKPVRKMGLYNGALQCIFAAYPLFNGKWTH